MQRPYSFLNRLRCASNGLVVCLRQDRHIKVHMAAFAVVMAAGILLGLQSWEWVAVVLVSAAVISLELINSALERALDKLHPDHDPMIGQAKDILAGAVLVMAVAAVAIGLLIFLPRISG